MKTKLLHSSEIIPAMLAAAEDGWRIAWPRRKSAANRRGLHHLSAEESLGRK